MKLDNRQKIKIIIIIISIIFFILLIYYFMTVSNKLIGFRVIKDYGPLNKDGISNFNELKNKYKINNCEEVCKQEFCDEYHIQKIKYDLCKDCKEQGKCYDQYKGICVPCKNNYSCEELFGCNGIKPPIDPINNYCTRCWIGTDLEQIMSEETLFLYSSSVTNTDNSSSTTIPKSSLTTSSTSSSKSSSKSSSMSSSKSSSMSSSKSSSKSKSNSSEEESNDFLNSIKSSYFPSEESINISSNLIKS